MTELRKKAGSVQSQVGNQPSLFQSMLGCLGVLFRLERRILALIFSYSLAIGLFSLIVPLTVQELVNTFAFAIQPITIVTLAGVMVAGLLFVGAFRALQFYAVEVLGAPGLRPRCPREWRNSCPICDF